MRCTEVATIDRSFGRVRQAAICSLSVAFARPKYRATDAAEHNRCRVARQATSARPRADTLPEPLRSSVASRSPSLDATQTASRSSAPSMLPCPAATSAAPLTQRTSRAVPGWGPTAPVARRRPRVSSQARQVRSFGRRATQLLSAARACGTESPNSCNSHRLSNPCTGVSPSASRSAP